MKLCLLGLILALSGTASAETLSCDAIVSFEGVGNLRKLHQETTDFSGGSAELRFQDVSEGVSLDVTAASGKEKSLVIGATDLLVFDTAQSDSYGAGGLLFRFQTRGKGDNLQNLVYIKCVVED